MSPTCGQEEFPCWRVLSHRPCGRGAPASPALARPQPRWSRESVGQSRGATFPSPRCHGPASGGDGSHPWTRVLCPPGTRRGAEDGSSSVLRCVRTRGSRALRAGDRRGDEALTLGPSSVPPSGRSVRGEQPVRSQDAHVVFAAASRRSAWVERRAGVCLLTLAGFGVSAKMQQRLVRALVPPPLMLSVLGIQRPKSLSCPSGGVSDASCPQEGPKRCCFVEPMISTRIIR